MNNLILITNMVAYRTRLFRTLSVWGLLAYILAAFATPMVVPATVQAADPPLCKLGQTPAKDKCRAVACDPNSTDPATACACDPALPSCAGSTAGCTATNGDCGLLAKYVLPIINFLAAAVGVVVTIAIVVGGIQYSASSDDPQKVAQAKQRIINAILGLVGFMFVWALLQWLIPGGAI